MIENLGNNTMKPFCGSELHSIPHSYFKRNRNDTSFCGVTEELSKRFYNTQAEIIDEFIKDSSSRGIAGQLPANWLAKIKADTPELRNEIIQKVMLAIRSAVKHLKPYNAPLKSKEYSQHKANLENKRAKEASRYLTQSLRHFGVLDESNSVNFKILKANGNFTKRAYVLNEKGKNPTLEKLFIKNFKKVNPLSKNADYNGKYSELAHWLYLNKKTQCPYFSKIYWGDTEGSFIALEYETPPKYISPIVKFKTEYENIYKFAADFYRQTGIELSSLFEKGIKPGIINKHNKFEPARKEALIMTYLQQLLKEFNLYHTDLHNQNAIIGQDKTGHAIVKIVDIGGLVEK